MVQKLGTCKFAGLVKVDYMPKAIRSQLRYPRALWEALQIEPNPFGAVGQST